MPSSPTKEAILFDLLEFRLCLSEAIRDLINQEALGVSPPFEFNVAKWINFKN